MACIYVCCRELAQAEACPVVSTAPGAFAVDVRAATRALRQQHTEAVVRDRFPPLGAPRTGALTCPTSLGCSMLGLFRKGWEC